MPASVKRWLETAGKFAVEHIPCPHFSQPIDLMAPRAGVLHTTEGEWDASMGVFKQHFAPHFLLGLDRSQGKVRIAQLVQVGTIGAALVTHNWLAIVQVEVIGYSKETPWFFDDETSEAMASLMAVCYAEYGIPLSRQWADGYTAWPGPMIRTGRQESSVASPGGTDTAMCPRPIPTGIQVAGSGAACSTLH